MITLTRTRLAQLTGAELLAMVAQQRGRHAGDLQIGETVWRVYSSTNRGRSEWVNLWREVPNGNRVPPAVHVQGDVNQTIAEMSLVHPTVG